MKLSSLDAVTKLRDHLDRLRDFEQATKNAPSNLEFYFQGHPTVSVLNGKARELIEAKISRVAGVLAVEMINDTRTLLGQLGVTDTEKSDV